MYILLQMQKHNELGHTIVGIYALCKLYLYNSQSMLGGDPST